jgi:hypothetical protein
VPGYTTPFPISPAPTPFDAIDATRLAQRLAALSRALDDLPRHARRFARWQAVRAAGTQASSSSRPRRLSPLRPGRPPGQRSASSHRPAHEVHEILADLQHFARRALEGPDTS